MQEVIVRICGSKIVGLVGTKSQKIIPKNKKILKLNPLEKKFWNCLSDKEAARLIGLSK